MQKTLFTIAVAGALALAACGKDERPNATTPTSGASTAGGSTAAPAQPQSNTPTTPANTGQPTMSEKREGANPQQQQVDPKESAQHRDFKQKGDAAGPQSAETAPRN